MKNFSFQVSGFSFQVLPETIQQKIHSFTNGFYGESKNLRI
ncbi:MAG: hypothetical protein ABIP27_21765 [Flavobacterium circumlabens]|nr:hypothetical protein [Flavobacterium circumlabens]